MRNNEFGVYLEKPALQDPGFKAHSTIDFGDTNPSDGNYIKLDGTQFTFKDSTANDTDVKIGSDVSATIDNFLSNGSLPDKVTLTKVDTDKIFIEYNTIGDSGNNFTLDSDFITVDSHLNGGTDVPDPDWVQFDAQVNFKPFELLVDTDDTDSTSLWSYNYPMMKEGNKVLLIDSTNNVTPCVLTDINEHGTLQTLDPNHIGSKISLDSTHNVATRNSDSNSNVDSQVYGYIIDKGNIYWEVEFISGTADEFGIRTENTYQDSDFANTTDGYGYKSNGYKTNGANSGVDYGESFTLGNRLGVRYCYETGELEFYKNGTSQGIAFVLDVNTKVYPAVSNSFKDSVVQLFSDPKDMLYLPDDCIPYGMLQYSADITAANLDNAPVKAFMDNRPLVLASMEEEENSLVPVATEKLKPILDGSTKDKLITDKLVVGEEIIIDEISVTIVDANLSTDSNGNANYDISGLGLTKAPEQVISKGYVELTKDTSDTSSFTGLSIYSLTPKKGDNILTDKGVVQVSNTPTIENISTVNNPQPLLDNSEICGYSFEDSATNGPVTDMNGNYNGQWYTLDSNGNPVTCDGSYTTGKFGNAASLDGSKWINEVYSVPNNGSEYSISLWINISAYADSGKLRYIYWSGQSDCIITIDENGYLKFTNYDGTEHKVQTQNQLSLNTWYYVLAMKTNSGLKLYIDRSLVSINSFTGPFNSASDSPSIGSRANSNTESFNGLIDEVRILNKALTEDEIKVLYNEQLPKYTLPLPSQNAAYQFAAIPPKTINVPQDTLTFDGSKFTNQHKVVQKQGRAIQRRIIMPNKYIEVLPPFTSNMWKKG